MKLEDVDVDATIKEARKLLQEEPISPAFKSIIEILILLISILINRLNLNSKNSSKPPSSDQNREGNNRKKNKSTRKPGGQHGHKGTTLEPVDDPDEVLTLPIDRRTIPAGIYKQMGFENRQVFDIRIQRWVTEYKAEILEDADGNQFVAQFPDGVNNRTQYGTQIKAHAVYLSQFQLLPYQRIQDYFSDQVNIPISPGTLVNFNKQAYEKLAGFDKVAKQRLIESDNIHADETGINVNGDKIWLHNASNDTWTYYYAHPKRGCEAMDEAGILPHFNGILCHDHWKPYYRYSCTHALCNAHHLRELESAYEQANQQWAKDMQALLEEMNVDVKVAGGALESDAADEYREKYRAVLDKAEKECPPPVRDETNKGKRGRLKRSKSRNLLERLKEYEADVLRFLENIVVPFTNNQGENDIRMTKVQQKISGCFRSMEGAKIFCRNRSYISTCRKNGVSATQALNMLFEGKLPDFINST